MAEDKFLNILGGFILFSLFGFLILSVVNSTGQTYEKDMSEVQQSSLDINKFTNATQDVEAQAKVFKARFDDGDISGIIEIVVTGIFEIARDMVKLLWSPVDLLFNIMIDIFGIPSIVASVFLGILIMTVILSIWRLIKIGD